jgi:hypothetical protein
MDDETREAMREEGYEPDGPPPPDRLWLMPLDTEGDRHWAESRVTPWDTEYVHAAAALARVTELEAILARMAAEYREDSPGGADFYGAMPAADAILVSALVDAGLMVKTGPKSFGWAAGLAPAPGGEGGEG